MDKLRMAFSVPRRGVSVQVGKYLLAGGTSALTELAFLYIFTNYFSIWYLYSLILAFSLSFLVSFSLQKFWTFRDKDMGAVHVQVSSYLFVALTNLALNVMLLYFLVQFWDVWYLLAQIFIDGIIAVWSFLIYKFFIFKRTTADPAY